MRDLHKVEKRRIITVQQELYRSNKYTYRILFRILGLLLSFYLPFKVRIFSVVPFENVANRTHSRPQKKKFSLPETSPRRGVTPEVFIDRLHTGPVLRLLTPAPELKGWGLAPETSGSGILAFLPVTPCDKTLEYTYRLPSRGLLRLPTYSTKFFDSSIEVLSTPTFLINVVLC